jgi:tRNA(Ile)-lysidine synthase
MHLIRGCGIDGLAGIPAARGNIRRPLLCCSRAEVEEYCALHNLPFVTDETNVDVRYTRNAVRHKVLPLLREINPSVGDAVLRLSGLAQADTDYLNDVAAEALSSATQDGGYLATVIAELPLAIRRRVIRLFLREVSLSSVEEAYIAAVDDCILHHNGMVSLCDGYTLFVEQGLITVQASRERIPPETVVLEEIPCSVRFGEFDCSLTERDCYDGNVHNLFLQSTIDCDKIEGKLCLRCRQTGDYMHPAGRGVGKSLKKLMNEWHIPAHIRDVYPLLCDEQGVVSVPGYACDERVKVTDATKHYLVCEVGNVQG